MKKFSIVVVIGIFLFVLITTPGSARRRDASQQPFDPQPQSSAGTASADFASSFANDTSSVTQRYSLTWPETILQPAQDPRGPRNPSAQSPKTQTPGAQTKKSGVLPSQRHSVSVNVSDTVYELPLINPTDYQTKPNQIGIDRVTDFSMKSAGKSYLTGEAQLAILSVKSPGAVGVRVHITDFDIPEGDEVYIYGNGPDSDVQGPYTAQGPFKTREFWSGTVQGDTAVIEYYSRTGQRDFRISEISHLYTDPVNNVTPDLLSCQVDASCSSISEKNAVGRIVYQNAGSFVCSGTLLNDTDASTFIPYFLTANHCVATQAVAQTVETYWFYQTSSCNSGTLRSGIGHTVSGANLLATSQSSDSTLIRILGSLPGGLWFSGWDAGAKPTSTAVFGLHHPGGGKPPSIESYLRKSDGTITVTARNCNATGMSNGYQVDWSSGVTEPGSSGSGLWYVNQGNNYVIGVLSCGPTNPDCNFSGDTYGVYGKFSNFFPLIESYINPTSSGPANNNFSNAQTIAGGTGSTTGSNVGATKESGEPNHANNAGGASVWYLWQAPSTGSVTITTAGSGFDTLLGVYTGTVVNSLTTIASNDDDPSGGTTSRVNFNANAGTTYRIAVDGYDAATGSITLNWSLASQNYTISLSASPPAGGTVGGAGTFAAGSSRTVTATANGGYTFTNWTESGNVVSTSASYNFTLNSNRTLVANFTLNPTPPTAPAAVAANSITSTSFNANWNASSGATGYRLDVSTSNTFNTFVSGFQNLDVGNVLSRGVSGLSPNLSYFYRVRAYNSAGTSGNSNIISVTTLQTSQVQFSSGAFAANETAGFINITVNRSGSTGGASSVSYATSNGTAKEGKDYIAAVGVLNFAAGEASKTFPVLIINNSFVDGSRTVNLTLTSPNGATLGAQTTAVLTISNDDATQGANPLDTPRSFVQLDYYDFLARYPDQSGWDFWTNQITSCGASAQCIEVRRINVSASFFLSIEFQQTGYLVERFYKVAFGNATGNSTFGGFHSLSVPIVRFNEFLKDSQRMGRGVVVLAPGWEQLLESNKQAYAQEFVQTPRFLTAFPTSWTPTQFVDKLNQNAGNVLSAAERTNAINLFGGALNTTNVSARAQAVRFVAEDIDLYNAEFNRAFVLAQYFGYLRRNPNDPQDSDYTGYDFWLTKLNQFNGNYIAAEMVKAFLTSIEYRQRFGP